MSGHLTVYSALSQTAAAHTDARALSFGSHRFSYTELLAQIDATAAAFAALQITHRKVFAIYAQNCPEIMFCYYAAAKVGAVIVPINPNMTSAEVQCIVEHCEACVLFHDASCASNAAAAVPEGKRRSLNDLRSATKGLTHREPEPGIQSDDDFLIIYTSGSTGKPKAVVLDHRAQVDVCESLIELWSLTARDVTLVALPLGYLYGLSTAAAVGLRAGGHVVVLPKFRPDDVLEALVAESATVFHGVPTMFTMMLEYVEQTRSRFDLSSMRQMISAGAHLPQEIMDRFENAFHKNLNNYYAMTECTPVFGVYASDLRPVPRGAIGRLAPGTHVRILNTDGRECRAGEEGELYVKAAATLKCYRNDPTLTAESLREGFFKSGDLACFDADGYFYLTGRIKDIIIRGGSKIAPAEVERVLSTHEAVQDVAVVGVADRVFGEVPVAFVVVRLGNAVTPGQLIQHAQAQLADFKVPREFRFVTSLPLGITGKVDKKALKTQWSASA